MKFLISLSILVLLVLSGSQKNDTRIFCNNRILNEDLVSVIEDFVKRGQNTKLDSMNSYLVLTLYQYDSIDEFSVRQALVGDLLYCHQQPVIIMVVPQIRTGNKLKKSCTFKN